MRSINRVIAGGVIILIIIGIGVWVNIGRREALINPLDLMGRTVKIQDPPEVSGWVAWWKEQEAYDLIASRSGGIKSVSPVWWLVNENLELEKTRKTDRQKVIVQMKSLGLKIFPTLGSELTGKKLSPLFSDAKISDRLISSLLVETLEMEIDGLDIDLEGIDESDREEFVQFLTKLKEVLDIRKWKLSVTIQAQDGKNFWFGAKGQDIVKIAEIADEVRIMAYDRHSASSRAGPIAPLDWIRDVAAYNLKLIPREKIVMGIPSYGYIWPEKGSPEGLQYDEFWEYLNGKEYEADRDKGSKELQITGEGYSGWLSDGEAMREKIELYRSLGLNRFVIWHVGGIDEAFFDTTWRTD
jgi:spore germination protein